MLYVPVWNLVTAQDMVLDVLSELFVKITVKRLLKLSLTKIAYW